MIFSDGIFEKVNIENKIETEELDIHTHTFGNESTG